MPRIDISSSRVRVRARSGQPIRYLVPDKVANYVGAQSLYGALVPASAVVPPAEARHVQDVMRMRIEGGDPLFDVCPVWMASPETVASAVALPLEKQFATISGLDSMNSTSTQGSTNIVLQFDLSRDLDAAAQDVQAAIAATLGKLPADMPRIAGKEAKWEEHKRPEMKAAKEFVPEDVINDPVLMGKIERVAKGACKALLIRDYARIDMRLTADGTPFIIEVNPNPWLDKAAEFAMAARHAKPELSYGDLIERIVELAMARPIRARANGSATP